MVRLVHELPPLYVIDDDIETELDEFVEANDFDEAEKEMLRALKPGQTYVGGGGAAAEWTLTRLTVSVSDWLERIRAIPGYDKNYFLRAVIYDLEDGYAPTLEQIGVIERLEQQAIQRATNDNAAVPL